MSSAQTRAQRWVVGLGMTLLLFGCGGDEENTRTSEAAVTLAWGAYTRKDFSTALLEFERAAQLDPTNADAKNGIGWTQLSLVAGAPSAQTLERVTNAFRDALRRDQRFADAWVGLGHALFLRRGSPEDYRDAAHALETSLTADRASLFRHDYTAPADVYALAAWCYYYAGDVESARTLAQRAITDQPNEPSASLLLDLLREWNDRNK